MVRRTRSMPLVPALATLGVVAGVLYGAASRAEDVAMPKSAPSAEPSDQPVNGMRMTAVEARFGAPATRHDAVGRPPITRWDYANFVVFFENDLVIHAVRIRPAA